MKASMTSFSRNLQTLLAGIALVGVSLVGGAASAESWDRYDRTVYVINNTSETLMEFYASNVGECCWQEDFWVATSSGRETPS